jgi:hypothetical protein
MMDDVCKGKKHLVKATTLETDTNKRLAGDGDASDADGVPFLAR